MKEKTIIKVIQVGIQLFKKKILFLNIFVLQLFQL